MAPRRIGLVGHCGPDASYLMLAAKKAVPAAEVVRIDDDTALDAFLAGGGEGLLLVNRVLDGEFGGDSGIELIRRLRQSHATVALMLVSNFDSAQEEAIQAGAMRGFGKREIGGAKVNELIKNAFAGDATRAAT